MLKFLSRLMMEANHLPLGASKSTFGSETKSGPVLKKDDKVKFLTAAPCLVKISPAKFTISKMWLGPGAPMGSGGAQGQLWKATSPSNPAEPLTVVLLTLYRGTLLGLGAD